MDGMKFGTAVAQLTADSSALPELAREGVYGIEVVLIVAVVVMACFFLWSFCRRETRREKELLEMGQSWTNSINMLSVTMQEYIDSTRLSFSQIKENVAKIGDGIEAVCSRVGDNEKVLARHEEVIVRHEGQISELEKKEESMARKKKCSGTGRKCK